MSCCRASSGTAPACPASILAFSAATSCAASSRKPRSFMAVASWERVSVASDNDINGSIPLHGLKALETVLAVAGAFSGLDVELPAMPGADDVQIRLAEAHALIGLVGGDDFLDAMNQQAVAHRTALMRADVEERMQLSLGAHDADLLSLAFHHVARSLRHVCGARHEKLDHRQSFGLCRRRHLRVEPNGTIDDFGARHEQN